MSISHITIPSPSRQCRKYYKLNTSKIRDMGLFHFLGRQIPKIERLKGGSLVRYYPDVRQTIQAESAMLQRAFNVIGESNSLQISGHFQKARDAFQVFDDALFNNQITIATNALNRAKRSLEDAKQALGNDLHVHRTIVPLLQSLGSQDSRIGGEFQRMQQNIAERVARGAAGKLLQVVSNDRRIGSAIAAEIRKCIASNKSALANIQQEAALIDSVQAQIQVVEQSVRSLKQFLRPAQSSQFQFAGARLRESCKAFYHTCSALFEAEKKREEEEKSLWDSLNKIRADTNLLMVS